MEIKFSNLTEVASSRSRGIIKNSALSAGAFSATPIYDAIVAPTVGFHLYGDLFVSDSLSTAESEATAQKLLEAIEDVADIASAATALSDVWLFEVQGLRTHIFIEADTSNSQSIGRVLSFASYFAKSVDKRLRKLVGADYRRFCMAVAHGEAIVISTGRDGDDSVISLGNAANRPAKRLAREDIEDGILVLPQELAVHSPLLAKETSAQASNRWVHVDVLKREFPAMLSESEQLNFSARIDESLSARGTSRRFVSLSANIRDFINVETSTVERPAVAQGLVIRADLDGFTAKIEEASKRGEAAIKKVVIEFLSILQLPDAFEKYLDQPMVRLPWAGDCYNAVILPSSGQSYADLRKNLAPVACLRWHDPKGEVNETRKPDLKAIAAAHKWAVGIGGGTGSKGRLLIANITTRERSFLVAAGWGVRFSLEAQNSRGIAASESAVHHEDHAEMCDPYKTKFNSWEGGRGFRKAKATSLQEAADEQIASLAPEKAVPSIVAPHIQVSSRPYCRIYGE